jgi:hypothetical protein
MATTTTTTWKIAQLDRETADGYVFTAHYTVNATDETYSAGAYGSISFEKPDTLVAYADLTEEVVIGWIKDQLTTEKVTEVEAALQAQLDEQAAPTKASGTPWS